MTSIDSGTFLANGGYLQKGLEKNLRPDDLPNSVHDLLPARWYRDEKIFELEKRCLFSKMWMIASFAPRFQKTGDYVTLNVLGKSIFLIRDRDGNINAFHNICRHRGHPVTTKASGCTTVLSCKFHGWSYLPNGKLHKAREYMDTPGFHPEDNSLFKIHTHVTSQGFIFVNFDASEVPLVSFDDQFGDDFDEKPTRATGQEIGDEFALMEKQGWVYDHTWTSTGVGTGFNWKNFADGFQECYHCQTGHPTTLPKDFSLKNYYLRQGYGASRHYLPSAGKGVSEAYITWLYPIGVVVFSESLVFIERFTASGALDTSYEREAYRRADLKKPSEEYDQWLKDDVGYWQFVESEDITLAIATQHGLNGGVLGRGRLHPIQEHAVIWYQKKVRKELLAHAELEAKEGRKIDFSIPKDQKAYEDSDPLCQIMGPETEW